MVTGAAQVRAGLPAAGAAWLDAALTAAAEETTAPGPAAMPAWQVAFASAGRALDGEQAADAARVLLLEAAGAGGPVLARLYRRGSAGERRAVLAALPVLDVDPGDGLPLVEDALRTNDTRLVAAALGPYAAAHLPAHAWRHAVLKCLFTGVPVTVIAGLERRAAGDGELARMLRDFAAERVAAARAVPADLTQVLALTEQEG
ncbi:EboA domain-containing protein [Actinacidiphila rubida]|uniref:Sugar phosphate isomerase n=1 Tax=Actinacidiphila rubida TaxID=310780 RepID=A0A1H8R7J6_9ACTN|nr:EboA domain-containing protein [Actinacidiphila rubida]SEO62435.1 hypothetical protein SAMN05216267_103335 [Actinacidiphila rubida]